MFWGTWNIRTLYKTGSALILTKEIEKYGIKLLALQEVRWEEAGNMKISRTTIFNGKSEKGHKLGTGFAVHDSIMHAVKNFKDINPRISTITIKMNGLDMVIINVHAPTEEKGDDEKEEFYSTLEDVYNGSVGSIKIIVGDLNAKIGRELEYRATTGGHSLHERTNSNGNMLIDFAMGRGLIVKSTMFPRKDIHKYTWVSPDGKYRNQIDHVLINHKFKNCITNVRTLRGADMDSDHLLMGIWIKVKLRKMDKRKQVNRIERYNIDELKNENIDKTYKENIEKFLKLKTDTHNGDPDKKWKDLRETIKDVTDTTLGKKKNTIKQWFNRICEEAIIRRKTARQKWLENVNNENNFKRFKTRQKEAHNIIRCEKRKYMKDIIVSAENNYRGHRTRELYQQVNRLGSKYKRKERFLKDNMGSLITTDEALMERWKIYFEDLLNCNEPEELLTFNLANENNNGCSEPTLEEIEMQLKTLKNNKSPGEDGIQAELLKKVGKEMAKRIWDLIGSIWRKESLPEDWKTAIICPIYKKGDAQDCNNYRGISLLNVTYKILSNCILSRIKGRAEEVIGNYQGGFRMGRSTIDQIFILRQVFQKAWEFDKELHALFIDFQKAYDCIHRESVMKILKEFQFPNKLINLIMISIMETNVKVKVGDLISDQVLVKSGLRQGDALSPILFNLVLERVIREINVNNQGFKLQNSSIELLAYADDVVLLGESQESLKNIFLKLEKAAAKVGLQCNEGKTAYMCVDRRKLHQPANTLNIGSFNFNKVQQFKYLGTIFTDTNDIAKEVAARIQAGNKCFYGLTKTLGSRVLSRELKKQLYITLIRPVILYGAETWPLRKSDENKFLIMERKILRKIYGPVKDNNSGEWRRRKNTELEILFQNTTITEVIKNRRLQWAGHAWRSQNELIRTVLEQNPLGKRPLGRPKTRWEDLVKKDVQALGGGTNWKERAMDREGWRNGCEMGWS